MNKYKLSTGEIVTTKLSASEVLKRMNRLDTLRVLVEGYVFNKDDENYNDIPNNIYNKAVRAWKNLNNFTGIIRLTFEEKDWLSYLLESDFIDDEDKEVINFYTKCER